jgi:uncharacterized protein
MSKETIQKCTFYVSGMHCPSCELLIEKKLKAKSGVRDAKAYMADQKVEVFYHDTELPDVSNLNNEFKDLGYKFSKSRNTVEGFNLETFKYSLLIFFLFVVFFIVLEKLGLEANFAVNASSGLLLFFIFGLVASVSGCAALVGGLLLSLSRQWQRIYADEGSTGRSKAMPFVMFNAGRITSFVLFGSLLGLIGAFFKTSVETSAILSIVAALVMIVLGLQMLGVKQASAIGLKTPKFFSSYISDEKNFKGKYMPFIVGALTFFVPCGFTLMVQTAALATGDFVKSSLMLLLFSLGTLPMLSLISFSSIKFNSNPKLSLGFNYTAGLLVVFFAFYTLNSQMNVLGLKSLSNLFSQPSGYAQSNVAVDGNVQVMQMHVSGFSYTPAHFTLKSGVPVRWEIYNEGVTGCAGAVVARGLVPGVISLKAGMNVVNFTPPSPGEYKITCSMGMVPPVSVTVN